MCVMTTFKHILTTHHSCVSAVRKVSVCKNDRKYWEGDCLSTHQLKSLLLQIFIEFTVCQEDEAPEHGCKGEKDNGEESPEPFLKLVTGLF